MPRAIGVLGRYLFSFCSPFFLLLLFFFSFSSLFPFCALVSLSGCKSEPSSPATEGPVEVPPSLLAEATLRDPDPFWSRVRSGGGGALMSLPDTAAGAIFSAVHLDPRFAHLVAGAMPFQVALGEADDGGIAFVLAMKVHDLKAAQAAVGAWDAGAGRTVAGMVLLNPLAGVNAPPATLALSPAGYLVLASRESDLATLGPYATRSLPAKLAPRSSLQLRAAPAALAQAGVKATNLGAWATSRLLALVRFAAPPAFDGPEFASCVNPVLVTQAAAIGDLESATIDVDTGDGEVHAVASLVPKPGEGAAQRRLRSIHPATAAPLLEVPGSASYAFFATDTPAQRADDVAAIAPCFERALGALLGPEGREALDRVLVDWAKGRGDWDTVSVLAAAPSGGVVFRAPVADVDSATRSLRGLTDLLGRPQVVAVVEQSFGVQAGSVDQLDLPPFGKVTALTFARAPRPGEPREGLATANASSNKKHPSAPPIGLAWTAGPGEVDLGVGESPLELLSSLRGAPKLGDDRATSAAVRALGSDASFAAVLRPFGCCMTGGATSTPLTFGWGRRDGQGWSRVEMGYELVVKLAQGH